jgi:hypothetical protein
MLCQLPLDRSSRYRSTLPQEQQLLQETQPLAQQQVAQLRQLLLVLWVLQPSKLQLASSLEAARLVAVLELQQARRQVAARQAQQTRQTPSTWSKPAMPNPRCCSH